MKVLTNIIAVECGVAHDAAERWFLLAGVAESVNILNYYLVTGGVVLRCSNFFLFGLPVLLVLRNSVARILR